MSILLKNEEIKTVVASGLDRYLKKHNIIDGDVQKYLDIAYRFFIYGAEFSANKIGQEILVSEKRTY